MQKHREAVLRRLVFAAKARCECGAGFAYNRRAPQPIWDCSAILLGDALLLSGERGASQHSNPCAFYDMLSELHAAAAGATTRPD